jgi:hypothetical protein
VEARKARYRFYRGYPYTRVTAQRLRLHRPAGEFLCYVAGSRELVREVGRDIRQTQLEKTLTLFQEAA